MTALLDKNGYYHEYFLRSRPKLAQKITRTKVKGKGARKASSPETEPRFYELPCMEETKPPATSGAASDTSSSAPPVSAPAAVAAAAAPAYVSDASTTESSHRPTPPPSSLGDALNLVINEKPAKLHRQLHENLLLHPNLFGSATTARNLVPIAPAPPAGRNSSGDQQMALKNAANLVNASRGSATAASLFAGNDYNTLLAALKIQAAMPQLQHVDPQPTWFTTPGPSFF
jgi:hypothetical protein